jgi:hypothetical protein
VLRHRGEGLKKNRLLLHLLGQRLRIELGHLRRRRGGGNLLVEAAAVGLQLFKLGLSVGQRLFVEGGDNQLYPLLQLLPLPLQVIDIDGGHRLRLGLNQLHELRLQVVSIEQSLLDCVRDRLLDCLRVNHLVEDAALGVAGAAAAVAVVADLLTDATTEDADERAAVLLGVKDAAEQVLAGLVLALAELRAVGVGQMPPMTILTFNRQRAELLVSE